MNGLAAIAGPLLLSQTLSHFTGPQAPVHFAGAAFALAAAISLGALGVFLFATRGFTRLAPAAPARP
jgi:MFS transporter, DHA1 family, tetracycline resistance protein